MARSLIPLLIFIVLAGFLYVGLGLDPKKIPSALIEKPAPEFTLPTLLDPSKQTSSGDFKSKAYLLSVWASWCVSCRLEHPVLMDLAKNTDIPIVGLNYKDQREDAVRWLNKYGNPYTVSGYDIKGRVGIDWGVYKVPETFVVGPKGIIYYKHLGPLSNEILERDILPLIKKLNKGVS
ncbi:MAG: DsbE family thiol:disulfide interchange protein [Gammaproteobacteria bacterium]|nr:DsbE family thiol:disulfide interchange protein [Gammaproteobacteria bacterium]